MIISTRHKWFASLLTKCKFTGHLTGSGPVLSRN